MKANLKKIKEILVNRRFQKHNLNLTEVIERGLNHSMFYNQNKLIKRLSRSVLELLSKQ